MHVRAGHRLDQDWLLPPRMDEWIPPGHLARVVDAVVTRLDLRAVRARSHPAGAGAPPYDPALLLRVRIYGYLTQRIRSRKMARACEDDLPMLWRARGERLRHRVPAAFRVQCTAEIPGWMAPGVLLATERGLMGWPLGAVDGSKIHADVSKHQAMSYQRMQEVVPTLPAEIAALVAAHGAADAAGGAAPPPVPPDRLARRDTRLTRIQAAMAALEAVADAPESVTMSPAPAPAPAPAPGTPYNFTDPESAIMVATAPSTPTSRWGRPGDPPGQAERACKAHCTYDAATDRYRCPHTQELVFQQTRFAARGGRHWRGCEIAQMFHGVVAIDDWEGRGRDQAGQIPDPAGAVPEKHLLASLEDAAAGACPLHPLRKRGGAILATRRPGRGLDGGGVADGAVIPDGAPRVVTLVGRPDLPRFRLARFGGPGGLLAGPPGHDRGPHRGPGAVV